MKDVTLVAGIKDWTGDSKGRSVFEFFTQIDTYAKVSNWTEDEKALITKAKLQGIALQFVQGREFLANDACPYADYADCSPLSTSALNSCLWRVTIPDAVTIQFDLLKMNMVLLETYRGL
jgi:hypothetical protein